MRHQRVRDYLFGIVLCTFISAGGLSVSAQTPTPSPSPTPQKTVSSTLEHDFFKNILRDQKAIWTAPLHLKGDDARWLVPLGLGTAAAVSPVPFTWWADLLTTSAPARLACSELRR